MNSEQFIKDFNDFFNGKRDQFKCTMTGLIKQYPNVFDFKSRNRGIVIKGNIDDAKEIMMKYYIPKIIADSNGHIYLKEYSISSKNNKYKNRVLYVASPKMLDFLKQTDRYAKIMTISRKKEKLQALKDLIEDIKRTDYEKIKEYDDAQLTNWIYRQL